jgi:hypothetical protein
MLGGTEGGRGCIRPYIGPRGTELGFGALGCGKNILLREYPRYGAVAAGDTSFGGPGLLKSGRSSGEMALLRGDSVLTPAGGLDSGESGSPGTIGEGGTDIGEEGADKGGSSLSSTTIGPWSCSLFSDLTETTSAAAPTSPWTATVEPGFDETLCPSMRDRRAVATPPIEPKLIDDGERSPGLESCGDSMGEPKVVWRRGDGLRSKGAGRSLRFMTVPEALASNALGGSAKADIGESDGDGLGTERCETTSVDPCLLTDGRGIGGASALFIPDGAYKDAWEKRDILDATEYR